MRVGGAACHAAVTELQAGMHAGPTLFYPGEAILHDASDVLAAETRDMEVIDSMEVLRATYEGDARVYRWGKQSGPFFSGSELDWGSPGLPAAVAPGETFSRTPTSMLHQHIVQVRRRFAGAHILISGTLAISQVLIVTPMSRGSLVRDRRLPVKWSRPRQSAPGTILSAMELTGSSLYAQRCVNIGPRFLILCIRVYVCVGGCPRRLT
jgi:hypothetical protein